MRLIARWQSEIELQKKADSIVAPVCIGIALFLILLYAVYAFARSG